MVSNRSSERKRMCRYKTFFLIGISILSFQIYLAIRFIGSMSDGVYDEERATGDDVGFEFDIENSVNLARKIKDGIGPDDEDDVAKKVARIPANSSSNGPVLRSEELDFVPGCKIETKEAISAIRRAKTQKCKRLIANVTCLVRRGLFYPKSLPSSCPADGLTRGKTLGCFEDRKSFRLLNGYYGNYREENSPHFCTELCLQSGFVYAGVQYGTECFCGNDEPAIETKLPDSSCNIKCPNSRLVCGGYYKMNVYETGIAKFAPQIAATASSFATKPIRIAFLLTLNGRASRQVKRLVKMLYHKRHYFFIHVDARQDYLFRELLPLEERFANVRLTRKRYSTIWGGASLLRMLIECMRQLLRLDGWDWDFVINLSESDYPVKTLQRLEAFLSANRGRNFVKSHGRDVQRFIQKQGLDKTFVECEHRMWRVGDRKLPDGIQMDGGSDWVALSRDFVAYAAQVTSDDDDDELIEGLTKVFRYTLLPAETFFHTLLRNSKFCRTYVDNNLHVTNWKRKLGCKCQYKHVVDWCGCSPNDFRPDDWSRIQNTESRHIFFARKFEPIVNQAIIFRLERWLLGADVVDGSTVDRHSYWQNVHHHMDSSPPPDDSLLTIARSVIRLKLRSVDDDDDDECFRRHPKLLQVTGFHSNDRYRGSLILFRIDSSDFELRFEPKDRFEVSKRTAVSRRLRAFSVSTDYDQKEQISRNFPRTMGPYSEPVLIYELAEAARVDDAKTVTNLTFLWFDPTGRLMDVTAADAIPEDGSRFISHVKPALKRPLLPGAWTVKWIDGDLRQTLAESEFLVSPLEIFAGNPVAQSQVKFLHSGSDARSAAATRDLERIYGSKSAAEKQTLKNKSLSDSKRFGADLLRWIDGLANKFFVIGPACSANVSSSLCGKRLSLCSDTDWSSLSPDPKSELCKINETTGMFDFL